MLTITSITIINIIISIIIVIIIVISIITMFVKLHVYLPPCAAPFASPPYVSAYILCSGRKCSRASAGGRVVEFMGVKSRLEDE